MKFPILWVAKCLLVMSCLSHWAFALEDESIKLSFEQAVEVGLQANLDLIAAKYNISLAEADVLTASLWPNPSLLIDTSLQPFAANWNQGSTGGPRQYDLQVFYPLDLSGKRAAAHQSASEATRIAEASFQDAIRQKVLQIRLAYIDLITFQRQLLLLQERETTLRRLVEKTSNQIGKKTLDQQRALFGRDQAVFDARQKEGAVKASRAYLELLLGRSPSDPPIEPITDLRDFKIQSLPEEDSLVQQALEFRPDLKALLLTQEKKAIDRNLAEAQIWDNFNFQLGVSYQGSSLANPNDPGSQEQTGAYSWSAALQFPIPVVNRNQGNIQKAIVSKEQTEKQITALRLSIRQEMNSIYQLFSSDQGLILDYEKSQLQNAKQIRDSQQALFTAGRLGISDYFDALNTYQSTLSSYYEIVADYRRNLARINACVGKDLIR